MVHSDSSSLRVVVSGGQTGVDRAALDAALWLGIEHGGWCPKGRRSEGGRIPDRYQLRETRTADYSVRTEQNVVDSDGTLILYRDELRGGTAYTKRMAKLHQKPLLLIDLAMDADHQSVRDWLVHQGIEVLNVAGPRESTAEGIGEEARKFLVRALESIAEAL